jgi:hypothetical protein
MKEFEIEINTDGLVVERTTDEDVNNAILDLLDGLIKGENKLKVKEFMETGVLAESICGRNRCG